MAFAPQLKVLAFAVVTPTVRNAAAFGRGHIEESLNVVRDL